MPREAPLVSQYLERISRDVVEKYQFLLEKYVRHRQGIYALYKGRKLYYVGLASDLRWRLKQHLKDHHRRSWDRFSVYFTIGEKHLRELETLILRITGKPAGNKVKGTFKSSENLQHTLMRDIKNYQRKELLELVGREAEEVLGSRDDRGQRGKVPVLAKYIHEPVQLRATLKGKHFSARVRRDGSIRFRGRIYNSPSAAAVAACKRPCDGWLFWKYERAPGDWVKLDELRK